MVDNSLYEVSGGWEASCQRCAATEVFDTRLQEDAAEMAEDAGWLLVSGELCCPDCTEEAEGEEEI